jgi:NADH-quinone oxidoreductase subunit G
VAALPSFPGRDTGEILAATETGGLTALLIAGVDPADLPDPQAALEALAMAEFVVSLELRVSEITDRADVILPVAAVAEKAGTFVNWEGRPGTFGPALAVPSVRSDLYVLGSLADEMDVHLGLPDAAAARREIQALGSAPSPATEPAGYVSPAGGYGPPAPRPPVPGSGQAVVATWRNLLDGGRLQDGEPNLAGTARAPVARMSAATAAEAGTGTGGMVTITTDSGSVTLPAEITPMPDRVVWLPGNSAGGGIRRDLRAGHGTLVTLRSAE